MKEAKVSMGYELICSGNLSEGSQSLSSKAIRGEKHFTKIKVNYSVIEFPISAMKLRIRIKC